MNKQSAVGKVWHESKTGNHQGLVIDEEGNNIAVVYEKENAQLIASAPELLEACKEADKFIGSFDPEKDNSYTYMALCDVVKTLTEAIAKAEGRT